VSVAVVVLVEVFFWMWSDGAQVISAADFRLTGKSCTVMQLKNEVTLLFPYKVRGLRQREKSFRK
jgi:hypothetical protein